MSKKAIVLCLAVFLVCIGIAAWAEEKSLNRAVSEGFIVRMDFPPIPESFTVAPDNKNVAYIHVWNNKFGVILAGMGEWNEELMTAYTTSGGNPFPYDGIWPDTLIFSPDSKRVTYAALIGDKQFVVVDGEEGKRYEGIGTTLMFSPDSEHVAYGAEVGHKWCVVVDGKEGKGYDGIMRGSFIFSPDSKRVTYAAQESNKWFVVVDGEEGKRYEGIGTTLMFSPDSEHMAYGALIGDKQFVVVDGEEGKRYEGIGSTLIFSPDSKHVAYATQEGDKWFVVVDGEEGKKYDGIGIYTLIFSPDSRHVAYGAGEGDKWFVVVDGGEGKKYDNIFTAGWGKIIFHSADSLHYLAQKGSSIYLVEERIE